MNKNLKTLTIYIVATAAIITIISLLFSSGEAFTVISIHGKQVELYGKGIYAFDTTFKATINRGTDIVILFILLPTLLITLLNAKKSKNIYLLLLGLICCILYYSINIAFGVAYNRLFILYIVLLSLCVFTFTLGLFSVMKNIDEFHITKKNIKNKAVGVFLIISGLSVLVWLVEIIEFYVTGIPSELLGTYTTEATFIIDLGLVLPSAVITGVLLIKGNKVGYILATILLPLNIFIGIVVVAQSIYQYNAGVYVSISQFIGYVLVFVITSIIATICYINLYKNIS